MTMLRKQTQRYNYPAMFLQHRTTSCRFTPKAVKASFILPVFSSSPIIPTIIVTQHRHSPTNARCLLTVPINKLKPAVTCESNVIGDSPPAALTQTSFHPYLSHNDPSPQLKSYTAFLSCLRLNGWTQHIESPTRANLSFDSALFINSADHFHSEICIVSPD